MGWFGNINGWKIAGGLSTLITLVITYLAFAQSVGYWPYGDSSAIEMNSPQEGYRFIGDFTVELSGDIPDSGRIWLVAKDPAQAWYPLAEATATSKGHWGAIIHAEQIISPVALCAVTVNEVDASEFQSFLRTGDMEQGLTALPPGAESVACRNIQPARS